MQIKEYLRKGINVSSNFQLIIPSKQLYRPFSIDTLKIRSLIHRRIEKPYKPYNVYDVAW